MTDFDAFTDHRPFPPAAGPSVVTPPAQDEQHRHSGLCSVNCDPDARTRMLERVAAAPSVSTDHTDNKENAMSAWKMYLVDEPGFNGVVLASGDYPDEPDAVVIVAHAIAADGSDDRSALGARLIELLNAEADCG